LEPVSAGRLRDISLEFELDASLVTWIATANDVNRLDQPLRSRLKEFHVQLPTAEQCLVLAREVMRATIGSVAVPGFRIETNRLERDLAHLPARQIQQITREAMARALKAGRKHLERRDLPPGVLDDESDGRSSGYLH
jgi:ATP-dependent Lon protease